SNDPPDAQTGRHETEDCCLVQSLLNDAGGLQTAAVTLAHQAIVERRACPPRKPYKRYIREVPQAQFLEFCDRMSLRDGQLDMLHRDAKLVQFRIRFRHEIDEPCIQTARSYGFILCQTRRWLKLQLCVGLLLSESPERIRNNTAPGRIFREPDTQRPRTTASH